MNKNILITGANGQDGKIILKKLSKRKVNLFLLDRKFEKKIKKKTIKYFNFSLKNKIKLEKLFKNYKIDTILNLASNNPNFKENNYYKHYVENINNSKNLINNSIKHNNKVRFISCSSSRIFKKTKGLVNENSRVSADDFYSRFRIEMNNYLIQIQKKNKNFIFTNVILFNHDSIYRNKKFLMPRVVSAIISKNKKFLNEIIKENIAMDYSHADDICNGLIKIALTKKKVINIILSSGKKTYINNIIKFLIKKNKINLKFDFNKIKKNFCIIGNNKFAEKIINWKIKKNIFLAAQEIYKKNFSN